MLGRLFGQIFNIRPQEWSRVLVLYAIALLFFTGITWGETIIEAAFLHEPGLGVQQLPLVFTLHAIVQIISTAAYVAVADRVRNDRLLIAISILSALSIAVGVFMLIVNQTEIGFLTLYVLVRVIRGVFTLHWWTYVSDFYDTQASKRIVPVLNSVVRIGTIAAGLSMPLLNLLLPTTGIVILWMVSLVLVAVVVWILPYIVRRRGRQPAAPIVVAKPAEHRSYLRNVREGYQFVAQSPYLLWIAVSTLLMVVIFAILNSQPAATMRAQLPTVADYSNYIGVINGVAGLILLPIQLFLLNRIIGWIGLGNANLIFPAGTTLISGFLLGMPTNLTVAGIAYLDRTAIRLGIREPTNSLLFNAVPGRIKGRARAFIDGFVVPIGLLAGSGLLVIVPNVPIANFVLWVLVILAVAYLGSSWVIQRLYGRALVSMLEQEDFSFMLSITTDEPVVGSDMLKWLTNKLAESKTQDLQIFIAKIISEAGGTEALPVLKQIAQDSDDYLRLAIVDIVVGVDIRGENARQFFSDFLKDPNPRVRRLAVSGLEQVLDGQSKAFLSLAYDLLEDPSIEVRAQVIPALLRSRDMFYVTSAAPILSQLLEDSDPNHQIRGIQMLGETSDARFIQKLVPFLRSENDQVRMEAVLVADSLSQYELPETISKLLLEQMVITLKDPFENVRNASLAVLGHIRSAEAQDILLQALLDPSEQIRRIAVDALSEIGKPIIPLLEAKSEGTKAPLAKMAAVVLAKINAKKYGGNLHPYVEENLRTIYRNFAYLQFLSICREFNGMSLLHDMLAEQNTALVADIFYLLSSAHDAESIRVISESFRSRSRNVQANAVEALEALTGTQTSRAVAVLFDQQLAPAEKIRLGQDMWGETYPVSSRDVIRNIAKSDQHWMRMALAYGLGQIGATLPDKPEKTDLKAVDLLTPRKRKVTTSDLLAVLIPDEEPNAKDKGKGKVDPLAALEKIGAPSTPSLSPCQTMFTYQEIHAILRQLADDTHEGVFSTAQAAIRLMQGNDVRSTSEENRDMLSAIEKIIFLKEVSFFQNMSVEQLKVLATICEEQVFVEDQVIFEENDPGDALYVVVQGRVGIERQSDSRSGSVARLATLEERAYFGEMTLFTKGPRSTRAVALKNSLLLRVRREPLVALIRQYPDLSLELINVLSDRLREANDQIVQLTRSRPRELHKLYDKLDDL
jgi:CRP-like cAMP-binding protein/HEAT repeat protein